VRVELTSAAIRDLASIDAWYAERVEPELLDRWRAAVEEISITLARHAEIGTVIRSSIAPNGALRSIRMPAPFGAHRVFYVLEPTQVRVLRVLHEARERERWIPT
jgi:plasmid stabilization system protein ParE